MCRISRVGKIVQQLGDLDCAFIFFSLKPFNQNAVYHRQQCTIATEKLPPVKEGGGYASEILKPVKLAWWHTGVNRSDTHTHTQRHPHPHTHTHSS